MAILCAPPVICRRSAVRELPLTESQLAAPTKRIGIFSGSFDPVHKGHVAFALEAIVSAQLDLVYFVPETVPRGKEGITHISHRVAMLKLATRAHPKLRVLELPDKRFSVASTLPRLRRRFHNDQLVMLLGSDVVERLGDVSKWPMAGEMFSQVGLVVGMRRGGDLSVVLDQASAMPKPLPELHILETQEMGVSAGAVRDVLRTGKAPKEVLRSVASYAKAHWLYASVTN